MKATRRHLWCAVDETLAQPDVSDTKRNEAVSLAKLEKGDGAWTTRKTILGWILDTLRQTLELPAHRKVELAGLLSTLCKARRISKKRYERALGKLRFVAGAIPGAPGLFSVLQDALNTSADGRIRVTRALKDHLYAFARLTASLSQRPTHLAEIVPQEPSFLGATDAAKPGMGGVYYDAEGQPYVWRVPFPSEVQSRLVSTDNPQGTITNSDLEHTGMLGQLCLINQRHDARYATILTMCDNTPAVSRVAKGAASSIGPAAHQCIFACDHQRQHRYCHVSQYIPGEANVMADDASRLQHLTDTAFLAHFEQHYAQPKPWRLVHLNSEHSSKLISGLLSTSPPKPTPPSTEPRNPPPLGTGSPSAKSSESPLPSVLSAIPKPAWDTFLSTPCATDPRAARINLCALARWTRPSSPWPRASPTWVELTRGKTSSQEDFIPYTLLSSKLSPTTMTPQAEPTQSTQPSSDASGTPSTLNTPMQGLPTLMSSTLSLSPSSGSSARPNTPTPPLQKPERKPLSSNTSTSPSVDAPTTPPQRL